MAKDHYLPAGFIGRFSADTTGHSRDRRIWTHNNKAGKVMLTTPRAIGYKSGLYNLKNGSNIDKWDYEGPLQGVLDTLLRGEQLLLDDWLRVAVPFVTGLFVRGKEFNARYEALPVINYLTKRGVISPDNTNAARSMRLQRLLGPVTAARWVVLHSTAATPIISNDIGLALTADISSGDIGWAIPLDGQSVLGIFPRKFRKVASYEDNKWYALIEHLHPDPTMFKGINEKISKSSSEFIFGPSRGSVEELIPSTKSPEDLAVIMEARWNEVFSREEYVAHEIDWHILAAIANLDLTPDEVLAYQFNLADIDIKSKWFPPMFAIPDNLTPFPSGVSISENQIVLNLNLLDDFESHILRPNNKQNDPLKGNPS